MGNVKTLQKTRKKKYKKKEIKTMKKNMGGGVMKALSSVIKNPPSKKITPTAGTKNTPHKIKTPQTPTKKKIGQLLTRKKKRESKDKNSARTSDSGKGKEENHEQNEVEEDPDSPELKARLRKIKNDADKVVMTSDTVTSRSPGESPSQRLAKIMKKSKELDASCMKIISDAQESGDYNMSTKDKLELAAVITAGTALELTGVGAAGGVGLEAAGAAAIMDTGAVVATDVAATAVVDGAGAAVVDGAGAAATATTDAAATATTDAAEEEAAAAESKSRRITRKVLKKAGNNDDPTKNIKFPDPEKLLKRFKPHFTSDNGKKIYKKLVNCVRQSNNLKKDAIETYRATKNKITCNPKENNPKACGGKGCPDCGDVTCFCPRSATKADQMIEGMQKLMKTTKGPLPYIFLLITKILLKKIK